MTTKPNLDYALLGFVDELQARIVTAAESGKSKLDLDGLDAGLRAIAPQLADVAMAAAAMVAAGHAGNLANHRGPVGSLLAAARLEDVFAAVGEAQANTRKRDALTEARNLVEQIERSHSDALAALEVAVSRADIDEVLRLRPEVEVTLPAQLDAARLAVIDSESALLDEVAGHCVSTEVAATSHLADAEQALDEARAALAAAEVDHQTRTRTLASAALARSQVEMRLAELRTQRANAAAALEQSAHSRYRRLAGLPDETPPPTTATVSPVSQPLVRTSANFRETPVVPTAQPIDPFARRSSVLSQAGGF